MLDLLLGSRSVEKVLLFLFVNGKGYGAQIQRHLGLPLTPIQKALLKLESGGVIASFYEGKTRLYQFNPSYPLLQELEHLLKKAYTLLAPQEKKGYYVVKQIGRGGTLKARALIQFWEQLKCVTHLSFQARSKEGSGWNGKAKGNVTMIQENDNVMLFQERGSWQNREGEELSFSNVFRWTLDRAMGVIALEHLRHGAHHPVFLFHLAPSGPQRLASVDSHLCGGDSYMGQIAYDKHSIRFSWRVIGPKKNEEIDYYYW